MTLEAIAVAGITAVYAIGKIIESGRGVQIGLDNDNKFSFSLTNDDIRTGICNPLVESKASDPE